ncbi:retention module-containing protein, partial [Cognatazoarcus halotolerans]|uniref:retention module-containing protein n=1 Tax=Cognatazoarcus halotolerans TaxID=2686016 RepID=UPI001359328C
MADVLPIATVVAVVGKAFARDTDGNLRSLKPGDVLREGDTVITAAGDRVELALENGEPLFVQPNQTVQMTAELSDLTKPDASESAVASADVDRVIQTLEQGGDLNAELDAPAAGLAGGTGGDGNSFVRLLRIVESTEPLAFEFGTARGDIELPFNGLVGDNQDLPTAVPDTAQTERDHAVVINVLENDRSTAGGLHIVAATAGTGQVVINPDGTLTYTPAPGFTGGDTISYTIVDARGQSSTTTVTVSVTFPNDVPVATDDTLVAVEDTPLTGTLAANDTPSGDGGNVWALASGPANGNVTVNADGTFSYTPDANYNGPDSFTYTITDADGDVSTATAMINVAPVNDVPVATDDTLAAVEDTPLTGSLAANDTPSGDGGNVWALASGPANGSVTVNADGTFSYTPNANYNGPDSFTYTITDADGDVSTATATINVAPTSDAPIAQDDVATTAEDTPVIIDVLGNDSDPDGDTLTITEVGGQPISVGNPVTIPEGSVALNPDGTLTFTPSPNFNGPVSFDYTVTDGTTPVTATVDVTVTAVNDVPVAADDVLAAVEDTPLTGSLATNDTPSGDGGNVWALASGPANGSVTVNADGTFSYTPDANYNGPDSFTYTITDADGDVSTATATINVAPTSDAPIAQDDVATTAEDTPVIIDVLGNDSDPDGDTLTITEIGGQPISVGNPVTIPEGSVALNPDGTLTFTPNPNFNGPVSFDYTVTDGTTPVTATVDVTVTAVNDVPVATDDTLAAVEDTPLTGTLAANDTPSGDGGNVWALASGPANGSVTVNPDGTFSYTPDANYNGPDSFTYTITDADGDVSTATATINVAPVNDVPVATDDTLAAVEDTPLTGTLAANDTPSGDGGNVWALASGPANGSVTVNPDGTFSYTPNANYNGPDSFTYTITDADGDVSTATATINVAPTSDAPIAQDDVATTAEDTPVIIDVLGNDSDPDGDTLTITEVGGQPISVGNPVTIPEGSVALNPDGTLTFTPNPNFNGPVSFDYTVTDGTTPVTATVDVTVTAVNDVPVATDDTLAAVEDTPLTGTLAANDTPSGDGGNVWALASGPANGSVTVNADGTFSYTPDANYNGPDSFTYTITDADGDVSTATATINVAPTSDAPIAQDDVATTAEDTPVIIDVLGNDSDPDGDTLTITEVGGQPISVGNPVTIPEGSVALNPDGTLTFTPSPNFNGPVSFDYTVTDGTTPVTATVDVTVTAVNDVPVAVDDALPAVEDTPLTGTLATNDTPSGDGGNVWALASGPANGTVTVNPDGTFSYTPNTNYNGPDSFTYTITDADGDVSTATATINVAPVNDVPVAADDTLAAVEDTPLTGTLAANDTPSGDGGNVWALASGPANGSVTV